MKVAGGSGERGEGILISLPADLLASLGGNPLPCHPPLQGNHPLLESGSLKKAEDSKFLLAFIFMVLTAWLLLSLKTLLTTHYPSPISTPHQTSFSASSLPCLLCLPEMTLVPLLFFLAYIT